MSFVFSTWNHSIQQKGIPANVFRPFKSLGQIQTGFCKQWAENRIRKDFFFICLLNKKMPSRSWHLTWWRMTGGWSQPVWSTLFSATQAHCCNGFGKSCSASGCKQQGQLLLVWMQRSCPYEIHLTFGFTNLWRVFIFELQSFGVKQQ